MAKHDQRILKFLNQNADRAPTITEMMTRLNISISDISDSLGSLLAQGLISKKTNNQGIECWFPTGPQASPQQVPPMQVQASHFASQAPLAPLAHQAPQVPPMQAQPIQFIPSVRAMQAPEPQPPTPKTSPVQVSHIPMSEPVYVSHSEIPPQPPEVFKPEPVFTGAIPNYGLSQPASKGVGILTLIVGLVLATGFSIFMAKRLASQEVQKASLTFVDKKALLEATTAFKAFEEKTKTHVTALESEVKQLTAQLATTKAASDSLQTLAAKNAETVGTDAKGKAAAGKKTAVKTKAKSSSSAIAKTAARGAAAKKRKAAMTKASARETSEYSSSSESSYSDSYSTPNVPEPPGLEDLPPPPSE